MDAFGLAPYLFEPNYSEEELRIREAEAKNTTSTKDLEQTEDTDDSDTASSTSSARHSGCLCGHCTVMPTELENVRCHEVFAERHELTEGMCVKETATVGLTLRYVCIFENFSSEITHCKVHTSR